MESNLIQCPRGKYWTDCFRVFLGCRRMWERKKSSPYRHQVGGEHCRTVQGGESPSIRQAVGDRWEMHFGHHEVSHTPSDTSGSVAY